MMTFLAGLSVAVSICVVVLMIRLMLDGRQRRLRDQGFEDDKE